MERIIKILKNKNQTISCMESCTGGMLASEITNISGASEVFKLGLVTYSNEWKEYFGVNAQTIKTYSVYSINVAKEMANCVSKISNSEWGIGITGQLGNKDLNNENNKINTVYISIYNKEKNKYYNYEIETKGKNRVQKKEFIINYIKNKLYEVCK